MNKNKNKKNRKNENKIQTKVIRCKIHKRPVFEHEICTQFISNISSNNINNCENCRHSF